MSPRPPLLLTLLSAAILAAAVPSFISRARAFNASRETLHLKKVPMSARRFTAHGRDATLTDALSDSGHAALQLTYGDQSRLLPVRPPPAKDVPDLLIYGEWLAMLRIIPVTPSGAPRPGATEADDRYLLIVRQPPEGFDPDSWGSVRRKEWTFDFYELRPDGAIASTSYRFPFPEREGMTSKQKEERIAKLPEAIRSLPELQERTVEYDAALYAIPKLSVPNYRFKDTAFNWSVAGWTLPAAGLSILGLLAGLALTFAPRRRSPPTSPQSFANEPGTQ